MSILIDIQELITAEVISQDTADKMQAYYQSKKGKSQNRLFAVFGVLGSLLVGLGIILILAHNWDELSRNVKSFIAFVPLVLAQIVCGFVLFKKQESIAWRESSATFLFVAIASSISLVAQIYNISQTVQNRTLPQIFVWFAAEVRISPRRFASCAHLSRNRRVSFLFFHLITFFL